MRTDNAADIRLNAMLENCIFYISPMYEFSHSLDPKRTFRARAGYTGVRRQQRRAAQASAEPEFSPPELPYRIGSVALPRIRSP